MSMSTGGAGLTNEPNVTPMIDVLLVLLVIFMMIIPMGRKAIDVQLPDPTPAVAPANGAEYFVNTRPIPKAELTKGLKEIYDPRPEKIIFIKGDEKVKYQDVIYAMDASRGAGVKVIGATPKDTKK
jgi:biopolymer transport protein TolR